MKSALLMFTAALWSAATAYPQDLQRKSSLLVPTLAVGFLTMPALGACPRRAARIDKVDQHTGEQGLVLYKAPKLKVAPGLVSRSLRLPNRYATTYALKAFE